MSQVYYAAQINRSIDSLIESTEPKYFFSVYNDNREPASQLIFLSQMINKKVRKK